MHKKQKAMFTQRKQAFPVWGYLQANWCRKAADEAPNDIVFRAAKIFQNIPNIILHSAF